MTRSTKRGKAERDHARDKRVGTNSLGLKGAKAKTKFYKIKSKTEGKHNAS